MIPGYPSCGMPRYFHGTACLFCNRKSRSIQKRGCPGFLFGVRTACKPNAEDLSALQIPVSSDGWTLFCTQLSLSCRGRHQAIPKNRQLIKASAGPIPFAFDRGLAFRKYSPVCAATRTPSGIYCFFPQKKAATAYRRTHMTLPYLLFKIFLLPTPVYSAAMIFFAPLTEMNRRIVATTAAARPNIHASV